MKERSTAFGLLNFSVSIGGVLGLSLTGYLSDYGFDGGWPSAFFVAGILCCIGFVVFTIFATSLPSQHKLISQKELDVINEGRTQTDTYRPPVPWKAMLSSRAVIVYTILRMCNLYSVTLVFTKLPTYLEEVLHVSMTTVRFELQVGDLKNFKLYFLPYRMG